MFDFVNIRFVDVLDVLLVALLIYWLIKLVKNTSATGVFIAILAIYVVWIVSRALDMKILSFILGQLLGVGVVAIIVIFQPEIRRFLFRLGAGNKLFQGALLGRFFKPRKVEGMDSKDMEEFTSACFKMSETKTGALIVLRRRDSLESIIETGDVITAIINRRLIENIFFKNSPLHDGAMIMSSKHLIAARCTLPITDRQDIPPRFGMRHRAAIGVTEVSDAAVVVVSEETGEISFVQDGKMRQVSSRSDLKLTIENLYS